VLPHFWKGQLAGWQTRSLKEWQELLGEPVDTGPKYKNTPDFPKDTTLYNRPSNLAEPLLVVESVMSVVSKSHLWPTMCATFGASVTERQKLLLADHPRIILWFDNDNAGWKATEEVGESLSAYCDVFVVESDLDADAADLSGDLFTEMMNNCTIAYGSWTPPLELREVKK
jgi:DNA primase